MSGLSIETLIEIALKASVVVAASLAMVRLFKGLPASQRALIAHLGLLATVAMPALVLFGPEIEVAGVWTREAATLSSSTPQGAPAQAFSLAAAPAAGAVEPGPRPLGVAPLLMIGWAAGALVLAGGLALGLLRLFRLQREAAVLTDRDWLGALALAQHRMGVKQGTALLRSERVSSPLSWGLLRPTIVLSPAALNTPDRAEAILAHELAHVVRLDWLNLLIARLATALFWFNPLVWMLAHQAHELREEAADDVVLRGDVKGPDYAGMLVDFARGERDLALAAHGVAPGRGSLKRRLTRVLDARVRRDPARPAWVLAGLAAVIGVAVPLAAFSPTAVRQPSPDPSAEISRPDSPRRESPPPADPEAASELSPSEEAALEARVEAALDAAEQDPEPAAPPARPGRLSPEALASMSMHGVTPEWIAGLERELPWVRSLSADQLTALAIHDVTPAWVREMRGVGYDRLTFDQATGMAVHGIDAAYVRDLAGAGLSGLSVDQLIGLRIAGVDSRYVRRMEAEGITGVEEVRRAALIGPRPGRRRGPPATPPSATPQPPTPFPPTPPPRS